MLYIGGLWTILVQDEAYTCKAGELDGNNDENQEGQGKHCFLLLVIQYNASIYLTISVDCRILMKGM